MAGDLVETIPQGEAHVALFRGKRMAALVKKKWTLQACISVTCRRSCRQWTAISAFSTSPCIKVTEGIRRPCLVEEIDIFPGRLLFGDLVCEYLPSDAHSFVWCVEHLISSLRNDCTLRDPGMTRHCLHLGYQCILFASFDILFPFLL